VLDKSSVGMIYRYNVYTN